MSSIYKKGRDGYYYYQTYVYNPQSGKKDKRIFHALSTKDLLEAETKQQELDIIYDKQNHGQSKSSKLLFYFKRKPIFAIIVCMIAIIIFVDSFINKNIKNQKSFDLINSNKIQIDEEKKVTIPKVSKPVNASVNGKILPASEDKERKIKLIKKNKDETPKVIIPKYTIQRVERLSGAFKQGKIFVTINENSSNDSQLLICDNIAKRYSEFSNIIICLYTNDTAGKALAEGNDETISVEERKRSWLAMYTYNVVEGKYFDDNPSDYLGSY